MGEIYHELFFRPLYNLLVWLYATLPIQDIGLSIILTTLIIRFILYPLSQKGLKSQKAIQTLQPQIAELQKKYKGNREELARQTMALYKENKINPFASIGPMLIQLPVLIALYQVFRSGFGPEAMHNLYSFIQVPETINNLMFGLFDLTQPSLALGIIAGLAQFYQMKLMFALRGMNKAKTVAKKGEPDFQSILQKQMLYISPIMIVVVSMTFSSALPLYWLVTTLFSIGQEFILKREAPATV